MGIYLSIGRYISDAWVRRQTTYAVTDQRILVLRDGWGGGLKTIFRAGLREIELQEHGARGSIYFGSNDATHHVQRGNRSLLVTRTHFRSIENARAVFSMLQRTVPQPKPAPLPIDEYEEP